MTGADAREQLEQADRALAARFWNNDDIDRLLRERADFIDGLLTDLWRECLPEAARDTMALYAVGGYGRGELHPGSDLDLLIIVKRRRAWTAEIEQFVQRTWDFGCDVGHSVRTVRECRREAAGDITIATALYERRLLEGGAGVTRSLERSLGARRLWPGAVFFKAKRDEQLARHKQFDNIEYGLEPNLKNSPGGLRDIHTVLWILRREFGTADTALLRARGVLTELEEEWLTDGRRFLSWVRFGLHLIAGRKEDRLQFEYQRELAERLGYVDTDARRGVERFMQSYYRYVLSLREVNDIVLQSFEETIVQGRRRPKLKAINERFQLRNQYLETTADTVFRDRPSALLEMFVLMANRRDIAGVRASTIRSIRDHLHLIDDEFRTDPVMTDLFLQLLRAPYTLVSQLTRMRRYGILGRYLPEFGAIIGQMQHDLFHIYTVDAHTMTVIGNMRRFRYRAATEQYPVAHHCVRNLTRVELLYIAGLYHDIGKGRGGDHSELGAVDAAAFCERHGLDTAATDLVVWLVRQHLLMSTTAQRRDIYDPDVIHEFAGQVQTLERLDYLYALTAADITATNPTLWNSWRASLLRTLYQETKKALRRGLESPSNRAALLQDNRNAVAERLRETLPDIEPDALGALLALPGEDFYFRNSTVQGAGILAACAKHDLRAGPLVLVRDRMSQVDDESVTEIVLYATDRPGLFATAVGAMSAERLQICEASVDTTSDGRCLNSFIVLDEDGTILPRGTTRRSAVRNALIKAVKSHSKSRSRRRVTLPRRRKQMAQPAQVDLAMVDGEEAGNRLTVVATDQPGLLALLGSLFEELGIVVLSARITTLGNRVEDRFDIVEEGGEPFTDPARIYEITHTLRQHLDAALPAVAKRRRTPKRRHAS